ncbi:sorting and assembly machinery component 50 [Achlya hypogyna]|uniref:Sorting and assembly machinery component 50 n=1 Tax=Achlya hypogyna TaxID=1202772 RepID=A0A1V9ZEL1_ACHHY|nr:sorting and assembly machinery component 50 [Achlya hypogyna]
MDVRRDGPPLRVRNVVVRGNKRTSPELFEQQLQATYAASSFAGVTESLNHAAQELRNLNIFESVDILIDKAPGGDRHEADVTITVKELRMASLYAGVNSDGHEGTATTTCTLTNPLGHAERIELSASHGQYGSDVQKASYHKPKFLGLPLWLNADAVNEVINHERFSSYHERFRGGTVSLTDENNRHELSMNLGWRDIVPVRNKKIPSTYAASPSIMAEAEPSTKSSVKYVYNDDQRNDAALPTAGRLLRTSLEVAGLWGDVNFVKGEVEMQRHYPIGPTAFNHPILNLSLSSRVGAVKSYGADRHQPARISDRFFLGGPLTLRGFNHKGVGPRANPDDGGVATGDALGGEVYYSACASLGFPFPVPLLALLGLRGHVFCNAGSLMGWDRILDEQNWMTNLLGESRAAAGVGIVMGTRFGRFEANYSWVLKSLAGDRVKRAQLGLGLHFI